MRSSTVIEGALFSLNLNLMNFARLSNYKQFKDFSKRMLVATNLFGRGMDIERVNIVFNYDMPDDSDTYLHRVSEMFPRLIVNIIAGCIHGMLGLHSCGSVLPGFNLWRQYG